MVDVAKHGRMPAAGQARPGLKPGETSRPSSVAQAKVVKDPLKVTGQKSNIKLTLIKVCNLVWIHSQTGQRRVLKMPLFSFMQHG